MRISISFAVVFVGLLSQLCVSAEDTVTAEGPKSAVHAKYQNAKLLVKLDEVAAQFDWEAKIISPGRLAVLCRRGREDRCIPIRIDEIETATTTDGLFLDAMTIAPILGFKIVADGARVTLAATERAPQPQAEIAPYHAPWGPGRGFEAGQTLPDIPLFDLQGREVRFSHFLGKQYILYCWASW